MNIRQTGFEMKRAQYNKLRGRVEAEQFIESADMEDCIEVLEKLTDRVATLLGCATKLEDALYDLRRTFEGEII